MFLMKANKYLKGYLVFQSFALLFALLFIKHFHLFYVDYIVIVFKNICQGDVSIVDRIIEHRYCGSFFICLISFLWLAISFLVLIAFSQYKKVGNYASEGLCVEIIERKYDAAASFLMTFIIPLFAEDVNSQNGLLTFVAMIIIVFFVVYATNLFYANPILMLCRYKVIQFKFKSKEAASTQRNCIGIVNSNFNENEIVKSKYIADDVYFVLNEKECVNAE